MSEFVEVKTADLVGAALDLAVAKALGIKVVLVGDMPVAVRNGQLAGTGRFSTDWAQGGPLLQEHKVMITYHNAPDRTPLATTDAIHPAFESGETILIAACRAIVVSVLGETVSVPKELLS